MPTRAFAAAVPSARVPRSPADALGVVLSCACALHCVAVPLALMAFPAVRAGWGVVGGEGVEWAFVAASAVTGAWALGWRGWRAHGRARPLAWFVVGLGLVLAGRRGEEYVGRPAGVVVVVGAAAIVAAHMQNRRLLLAGGACHARCCAPPPVGPCAGAR